MTPGAAGLLFGLLNVYKPPGMTSRDVVDRVERLVRPDKAGHAGTLDPLATGVLVVCVGKATRLIEYVQQKPKRYRATFLLGRESESEDVEREVTVLENPPIPTREQIDAVLPRFLGEIQQVPPTFSAIKVGGRRSYKMARRGEAVEMKARPIQIFAIDVIAYRYPELVLDIACGSGTYVRSLGRDVARALSTEAVMSALERTAIGEFRADEAVRLDDLTKATLPGRLQSALLAVAHLPRIVLDVDQQSRVARGMTIFWPDAELQGEIAAVDEAGELVALLEPREPNWLRPLRNFVVAGPS